MMNEYMRKKTEGLNLGERIEKHLEDVKDKDGFITLIDDAFFHHEVDRGMQFHVRRTNLMRDKRTLTIVDEIEEKEKMLKAFEDSEAKRDMTYEEYLARYADMIDGKVSKDKGSNKGSRPVTGKEVAKSESAKRSSANQSNISKGGNSGINTMNNTKEGFNVINEVKFDIPDSCFLIMMKGNKISKMDK